jgi:iron complex transport system permease protein
MALARVRHARVVGAAATLLLVAALVAPSIGSTDIDVRQVFHRPWDWENNPAAAVFFVARLPRVILAGLVGAGLSLCGVVYQALLRNPLASPYTLGISAGATLGAFIGFRFLPTGIGGELLLPAASLAGALLTTGAVFSLAFRKRRTPTATLLLAGVALNYTLSAGILLLQYLSDHTETARMVRWLMGDLEGATYRLLLILAGGNLIGWWVLVRRGRSLNLLSLGAEEAEAQGVNSRSAVISSLLWAAWITGLAVAVAGPIGFVGIVVPHVVRLLSGRDHRIVLPAALLGGAAFLVACDALARTLLAPVELPIGVITASLGGPFFLILLLRRQGGVHGAR